MLATQQFCRILALCQVFAIQETAQRRVTFDPAALNIHLSLALDILFVSITREFGGGHANDFQSASLEIGLQRLGHAVMQPDTALRIPHESVQVRTGAEVTDRDTHQRLNPSGNIRELKRPALLHHVRDELLRGILPVR